MYRLKRIGWADEEIQLLQWVIFNYACQNGKQVAQFVRRYGGYAS